MSDKKQIIQYVSNGFGEGSSYMEVGLKRSFGDGIARIERETKTIGAGYYNNLTIECYVGYNEDGLRVKEINEGPNVEVGFSYESV